MLLYSSQAQVVLSFFHSGVLSLLFFLFFVRNAIVSVLLVVCIFIISALCFIFFNALYISLVFIEVYIGAIAVLFLFVIMLTNKVYTARYFFSTGFSLLVLALVVFELSFSVYLNFFGAGIFWFDLTYFMQLSGNLSYRLAAFSDPLAQLGFFFFNYYSFYLVGLGSLLLLVLVGIVLLLRDALGNTLVVDRSYVIGSLRWRRLLNFRQFVQLKTIKDDTSRNSN